MLALIVTALYVIVSAGIYHDDYPRVHHPPGDQEHRTLSGDAEVLTDFTTDDVCKFFMTLSDAWVPQLSKWGV